MTDEELTRAYTDYADMVYRIALVRTKSEAQAEDIQQDVFMALVRYSDRIRSEEHLKAWLIRVTQNACHKHYRGLRIRLQVLFDDTLYKGEENEAGAPDPGSYPGGDSGDNLYEELVQSAVETLPEKDRTLIHLFYYEEMSVRDISRALNMSEQNTKTRLSRARDRLRRQLEDRIR